jgi:hypothetical protein
MVGFCNLVGLTLQQFQKNMLLNGFLIQYYVFDLLLKKLTLKIIFWHFLTMLHYINLQITILSFEDIDFWPH